MHKMSRSLQSFCFANSTSHCTTKYLQTISKNPEASAGNKLSKWIYYNIHTRRNSTEVWMWMSDVLSYVFLSGQTTECQHSQVQKENDWAKEKSIGVCVTLPGQGEPPDGLNIFYFDRKRLHHWDLAFDRVDSWWIITSSEQESHPTWHNANALSPNEIWRMFGTMRESWR